MTEANPKPDPRRNVWRADLAALSLKGVVAAPRYAEGATRQVSSAAVALRIKPSDRAGLETELLFGERVAVYDIADGWAWVQAEGDRYVGYVPVDAVTPKLETATHRVRAVGTFVYPEASIKTHPLMHLSLNARVAVAEITERFARLATGGFVMLHHLAELDAAAVDFVAVAERFEGTPYLWGGRTRVGLDCSGLVQIAMDAAGLACPRDTDMQRAEIGAHLAVPAELSDPSPSTADLVGLERGDLVFWPGHVGIMIDGAMLLHANGHHMSTVVEPLVEAAARIKKQTGHAVLAIKRPPGLTRVKAG